MKIKDFMITDVISVHKNMTIKDLLNTLVEHKIGGVPVVDQHNHLIGIISDGDVIRYLHPNSRTIFDAYSMVYIHEKTDLNQIIESSIDEYSEKIMRKKVHTVSPEDNIEEALVILSQYHFKKIPVVDDFNRVIGVVSRGDIIRFISTKIIAEAT